MVVVEGWCCNISKGDSSWELQSAAGLKQNNPPEIFSVHLSISLACLVIVMLLATNESVKFFNFLSNELPARNATKELSSLSKDSKIFFTGLLVLMILGFGTR